MKVRIIKQTKIHEVNETIDVDDRYVPGLLKSGNIEIIGDKNISITPSYIKK
jgi:uncharacterized protein YlxW (UPF0749 family)